MRLKNKISGEVKEFTLFDGKELQDGVTLESLTTEWEDYEEPKEYWYINCFGIVIEDIVQYTKKRKEDLESIGNYFSSIEEAELAVRKLKAWKRLKDKGFRFDHIRSVDGVSINHKDLDQYTIIAYADEDGCDQECLDLLFSGGEE